MSTKLKVTEVVEWLRYILQRIKYNIRLFYFEN